MQAPENVCEGLKVLSTDVGVTLFLSLDNGQINETVTPDLGQQKCSVLLPSVQQRLIGHRAAKVNCSSAFDMVHCQRYTYTGNVLNLHL